MKWDLIIDTISCDPLKFSRLIKRVSSLTKYIYISSVSAYNITSLNDSISPITEEFELKVVDENINHYSKYSELGYGESKVAIEKQLLMLRDNTKCMILRPSIIYGRYDSYYRFTYWMHQLLRKKTIVPNSESSIITLTYVDDIVNTVLYATNDWFYGVFNICSETSYPLIKYVSLIKSEMKSDTKLVQVGNNILLNGYSLKPQRDIPYWLGSNLVLSSKKLLSSTDIKLETIDKSINETVDFYKERLKSIDIKHIDKSVFKEIITKYEK